MPIPITVLGGYLGAGKTTLLNEVLDASAGRRIGVVVNDFGELGVDAGLLASRAADGLVDLPNGCVCCTLGTDLGEALDAMAALTPALDQIVIEASGVADPAVLAGWGTVPGFVPGGVFVLAAADDVRRLAADRYVGGEVRRQLSSADVVVVSRGDLVGDVELDRVSDWLARHTTAPIVGRSEAPRLVLAPVDHVAVAPAHSSGRTVHGAVYARWSWRQTADNVPSEEALARFLEALPPTVLRAKGVVRTTSTGGPRPSLVQVVGSRTSVTPLGSWEGPNGLVALGPADRLDPHALDQAAARSLG